MLQVGRAVGKLNKLLPKRQFILMGPGRWGSRGDIRLGVNVTYADINNTAALIEIARKKGNYVPDLSFGTHFFQDLVEANIRYLPLYPDDKGIIFNERFFNGAANILPDMLPTFAFLKDTIRLIDIPRSTDGLILKILLNADLEEGIGLMSHTAATDNISRIVEEPEKRYPAKFWQWRMGMAELIASQLEMERFGVKAVYVIGSTKNATAGPGSDIDLLLHVSGNFEQRRLLGAWLEGWNHCLVEIWWR